MQKNKLTKQSEDFSQWYLDVVKEAELAESSEVRGCGIIKPYGYKIWELIKEDLNSRIKETGAENVYFPLFVPLENIEAEKEHVDGFAPELAVVTHGGGVELVKKLAIRPTSETAMYKTYSRWVQSYRDLPMRLNQWNNVVRWELRTRPFLRWAEFQWQEGHTVFATEEESREEVWQMLEVYKKAYKNMAIPVFDGKKSEMEKFAGAVMTTTVEAMSKDGKAIQAGTSHYLGTNFSKVFDVKYQGEDGKMHYAHQNSWGFSWRSIGALIMVHGDDNGLRLPPNIAPYQIVIVPIVKGKNTDQDEKVINYSKMLKEVLENYRVKIDYRDNLSLGYKFNEWEVKGVPIRVEMGFKEIESKQLTIFRRDKNKKEIVDGHEFVENIEQLMLDIQDNLYKQASEFANNHIHRVESIDDITGKEIGFIEASWSETTESEKTLKEKFGMVSRVLPKTYENSKPKNKVCFITGKPAKHDWYFAKSY